MKKILTIFLSFILIFSFTFKNVYADNINIGAKTININKNNIIIYGEYPFISGLKNTSFQSNVNKKIDNIIKSKTTAYSQKTPSKIEVYYDTIQDENNLSIIIYFKNIYNNDITPYSVNIDIENIINSNFNIIDKKETYILFDYYTKNDLIYKVKYHFLERGNFYEA